MEEKKIKGHMVGQKMASWNALSLRPSLNIQSHNKLCTFLQGTLCMNIDSNIIVNCHNSMTSFFPENEL